MADQNRPYYCQIDFLLEFTFNTTRAAANLVLSGTMDRYPNIKFILGHAGGALPYLRWRIDQSYSWMIENLEDAVELNKRPAEYYNLNHFYCLTFWRIMRVTAE